MSDNDNDCCDHDWAWIGNDDIDLYRCRRCGKVVER